MRTTVAILLFGCLAAVPVAAEGQTSILPPTATLNPVNDAPLPHGEVPRGEALTARGEAGTALGVLAHAPERTRRGEGRPPHGRSCFGQAEARETIAAHRLIDPVRALRTGRQQGDALSARLCRWAPEEFVYEVNVLRHDGRILRLFMNAQSGESVGGSSQAGAHLPEKDR